MHDDLKKPVDCKMLEGIELLDWQAKGGDYHALMVLALIYYEGIFNMRNESKAFTYLKKAHDIQSGEDYEKVIVEFLLGQCYNFGKGTNPDISKAFEYYNSAERIVSRLRKSCGEILERKK